MQLMPISQAGKEKVIARLEEVKKEFETLPDIIRRAREKGDLKENAEYHAAREKQGFLQAEINKLSSDISNARVVDPLTLPKDIVTFGKKVTLCAEKNPQEKSVFNIVGPGESPYFENSISINSTMARALLRKKVNEIVDVHSPSGTHVYRILSIEFFKFCLDDKGN